MTSTTATTVTPVNAVYTHWTLPWVRHRFNNFKNLDDWSDMTELSLRISVNNFQNVIVHTDEEGAKQIEGLGVDGLTILKTHERFMHNAPNVAACWAFAKIYTYLLQDQPFVHIDNDAMVDVGLRSYLLGGDVIVQHFESGPMADYVTQGWDDALKNCKIPDWMKKLTIADRLGCNAGVLGFNNIEACHRYAREALLFTDANFEWATKNRNFMWVEQALLGAVAVRDNLDIRPMINLSGHLPQVVHSGYRHFWGVMKHEEKVMAGVREELKQLRNNEQHVPVHTATGDGRSPAGAGGQFPFESGENSRRPTTNTVPPSARPEPRRGVSTPPTIVPFPDGPSRDQQQPAWSTAAGESGGASTARPSDPFAATVER